MGFEIFKEDEERPGFSVVTDTPRNSNLATGMAGTTLKRYIAPNTTSVADFRKLDEKSAKMEVPKYTPPSGAVKRSLGSLGIGLLEGVEKLRDKYAADKLWEESASKRNTPLLDATAPKYTPVITPEQSKDYEEKLGLKGTLGESIWRGIGTETPAIAMSYGGLGAVAKGAPALQKALTGAGKWTETGRRGVAAGALYTPIAEENPELKDYLENMALFGVGDVAFMGAAHGLGKGVEKLKGLSKKPTGEASADFDFLMNEDATPAGGKLALPAGREALVLPGSPESLPLTEGTNWRTPSPYETFTALEGQKPMALPAGHEPLPLPEGYYPNWETPTPYQTFLALEKQKPLKIAPGEQPKMLGEGYYPDWEYGGGYPQEGKWFVDPYGNIKDTPGAIKALPGGTNKRVTGRNLDDSFVPRSDIGDPDYLGGAAKRYNEIIDAEVTSMKNELGGVETIGKNPYELQPGQELFEGYERVSLNPSWYREWWQKHYRAPREGEWRDLAIKNLMEGNPETGEPANEEFLALLSELSRGQKLPEEWHGLQKTIRDTSAIEEPELKPLITDMHAEQAKVEPYGLTRDMGRLNEIENTSRGRMADKADFGEYEGVKFKRGDNEYKQWTDAERQAIIGSWEIPWNDMERAHGTDFAIAGARKILEGKTDYKPWGEEMIADYGNDIAPRLPELWQKSHGLASYYRKQQQQQSVITNRTGKDYVAKEQEPSGIIYEQSTPQERQRWHDEWAGKSTDPEQDSLFGAVGSNLRRNSGRMLEPEGVPDKEGALTGRDSKFKYADSTAKKAVSEANQTLGFTRGDKDRIAYAADGWTPEMELADKAANAISGTSVIPVKMPSFMSKVQGFFEQSNRKIFVNKDAKDPITYVAFHETGHRMKETHPEHYARIEEIAINNLKEEHSELIKRYTDRGYGTEDMPEEFTSDLIAEMLHDKTFIGKLSEHAPEVIKPLLDILDEVIAKVKLALGKDDSVLPYIENLERLRSELAPEYSSYLETVQGERAAAAKYRENWGKAAKVEGESTPEVAASIDTPEFKKWFGDSKVVDENGKPQVVYHGTMHYGFNEFSIDSPAWFSPNKEMANAYTGKADGQIDKTRIAKEIDNPGTYEAFLSIKNPYVINRDITEFPTYKDASKILGISAGKLMGIKKEYILKTAPPDTIKSLENTLRKNGIQVQDGKYYDLKTGEQFFNSTGDIFEGNYDPGRTPNVSQNALIDKYEQAVKSKHKREQQLQGYREAIKESRMTQPLYSIINTPEYKNKLLQKGYDGIIAKDQGEITYAVFSPTQIKSVYNRGTWDASNPDIRFKLGEDGKSIVDDLKAMITYGAEQLHKGGYEHFAKLIKQQFSKELEGYSPEAVEKLITNVRAQAKQLRDTGETQISFQGQKYPVKRETSGRDIKGEQTTGDMGDIDTRQHIVSKAQREPIIAKEVTKKIYTKAVDDLYRLDELDRFVTKTTGKHLPAEDKAYLLAINSREATGAAKAILEENLVDAQGNIIGQSFKEVLNKIPRGKEQDFRDYLVLRNSISWMEQGKNVYPEKWEMTPEKAMQRLAAYDQQMPELKQAADEYVKWHRDMAQAWLVDTGIITPEAWQAFLKAHPYYTPFQRQMKTIETTLGQGKARRGFANQTNPTKKAEGSERPIIDPIESTIEQVDRYIKTAKRNEVMQAVIRNLEKAPGELEAFAEVIPEKGMDALDNIDAILGKDGIDGVINYLEEPFEQMIARKGKAEQPLNKPNIVRAFVDGERVHVKVNDPVLLDALTALSDTGRNAIVESFRTVTRMMKILTTGGNPIFAARNIARDVPMAYVASDTLSKTPVVREVQFAWGMLDALARILTNEKWHPDKFYREYKAMGGGSHTASVAADRNILAESKSKVMPGYWRAENNNPLSYLNKSAKTGFQGIERFTSTVEALPRLPEYIRTVKKGGNDYASKLEGLHASQDVTVNFSRRGDISKDADAFIPYFNAAVQGIEKIARMFGKDPLGATYRSIVAVTVPTIGLYLLNKDNPNYHKLSSFVRDNYYCLPIQNGEKFIKIAKPREIGVMFSDLPERALRQWEADDPEGFYQFSEAWINNFVPPIRPIVMPLADVLANKDFAGRPIVPGYLEGLSPELQYDEKTSAAAKALGKSLKLSPKQIDYLFRSFTGVVGELGIPAMAQGTGQSSGQRVGEVLKRSFTADPLYSNDVTSKFYEEKELLDKAAADYKATGVKSKYYNPTKRKYYNRQAQRMSNIRKEIRKVNANPNLSYKEKEERTRRLQSNILKIAQKGVKNRFSPIVTAR